MLRRIFLTGLVIVITAPLTIFAADETVLMRAQELVDVFQREIGKPISEQSSSAFIEIKKRLEPLWNPLGNLALHDPAAAALKERLYEVSAGAEQRIGELRKLEAERERAELMRLALERQQDRRKRDEMPTWNEPFGFRDVPFGMSSAAVGALFPDMRCSTNFCSEPLTVGPVAVVASFGFRDGRFDEVGLRFDSGDFIRMKVIFLERYGTPTSRKSKPTQNRLGARFDNEDLLEWSGPEVRIRLERSSLGNSHASIRTQDGLKTDLEKFR